MKRLFKGALLICLAALMAACDEDATLQQEQNGDKIKISLSFNVGNSPLSIGGPMIGTKGSGEDLFDAIYQGIVNGEIIASYELTFKNINTGASTSISGKWTDNKTISLEKGTYTIYGISTAIGKGIYKDCSLSYQDEVTITPETRSITIKAQYDCSLLIVNDDSVDKILYYASQTDSTYFSQYQNLTYAFVKSAEDFTQGNNAYLKVYFNNGRSSIVDLGQINIQKGKYYLLENLNNYADAGLVLDIDKMENGDDNTYFNPIEFSIRSVSKTTRGVISCNSDVANNGGFKVWGFKKINTATDWTTVFDGTTVSSYDYGTTWTYAPLRYWDANAYYKFFAVAPAQNANGTIVFADNTVCVNNVHYMGPEDNDLECKVHRGVVNTSYYSYPGQVLFDLQHIMTKVSIQIRKDEILNNFVIEAKLKEIKLEGWNGGNGNYKLNTSATAFDATEWTIPVASNGIVTVNKGNGLTLKSYYSPICDIIMVPQEIDAGSLKMQLTWDILYDDYAYEEWVSYVVLNQDNKITWATGNCWTYLITVSPEKILFDSISSSWIDESQDEVI